MDSETLVDLVLADAPAHEITDAIKNALFAKSAERIEYGRPVVAAGLFGDDESFEYDEEELNPEEENG